MKKCLAIAFFGMILFVFAAASYAASYGQAEMVHFWTAVPAGNVSVPTMRGAGPPISMAPIFIDLDDRGVGGLYLVGFSPRCHY